MDAQNGATALHDVAERGDSVTTGLLLEAGADVRAMDNVSSFRVIIEDIN